MSNRLYFDQQNKLFVVLSYAGGTKYFRHLSETKLKNFVPVNANNLSPAQTNCDVIQIVREPLSRYMSWFDKQYIKPIYAKNKSIDLHSWVNNTLTQSWADEFFADAKESCHYDGHTAFQSIWPKVNMKAIYRDDWKYLRMEDINPYFLNEQPIEILRDPKEYVGIWDVMAPTTKDYIIDKIKDIYKREIDWYHNLKFIQPK